MSEPDDPLATQRKRLLFRSRHRGSREMDLLLGRFAERHLPTFSGRQLALFEEMLEHSDPDLYAWLAGRETPPAALMHDVMKLFLNFKYHDQ
jgi:antitoxin CptB